jgi:hypothetical protein
LVFKVARGGLKSCWRLAARSMARTTGIEGGEVDNTFGACISDAIVSSANTLQSAGSCFATAPVSISTKPNALSTQSFAHAALASVLHYSASASISDPH